MMLALTESGKGVSNNKLKSLLLLTLLSFLLLKMTPKKGDFGSVSQELNIFAFAKLAAIKFFITNKCGAYQVVLVEES